MLLTSLAPEDACAEDVVELYRLRWQIELAFKRLKSLGGFAELRAEDPRLVRSWLLAHLIAAVLVEDSLSEDLALPPEPAHEPEAARAPRKRARSRARGRAGKSARPARPVSLWRLWQLAHRRLLCALFAMSGRLSRRRRQRAQRRQNEPPRKRRSQALQAQYALS